MHIQRLSSRRSLGRQFGWLWAANAVSAYGSGIGFGAFSLIAIRVLHTSPAGVSALLAAGPAVGAVIAVPLGPWIEFRRKRRVMMAMDVIRFAALMTVPAAYALGCLTFAQLFVVSIVLAAAKIAFTAASGANLKALVKPEDLLTANGRFASTTWTSVVVGPPLGGAAIEMFGPVTTMAADAVSYLLSACGIAAIRGAEPRPERASQERVRAGELLDSWRYILGHPALRLVFFNNLLVGGLILATEPLLAVLLLGQLGYAPWQYTVAFGAPCVGGFIGSRAAQRLVTRFGQRRVMVACGTLCAGWPAGLAFVPRGTAGLLLVIGLQFGLVLCLGVYNPIYATYRLERVAKERLARALSAWSVSKNLTIAALTALWGVLASVTSPRIAIAAAGVLLLGTPALLPWRPRDHDPRPLPVPAAEALVP